MNDSRRLVDAARRLAETLTPGDLEHLLRRITKAAIEVLPLVDYASITLRHSDGGLVTLAATDPLLQELNALEERLGAGPCLDLEAANVQVTAGDLTVEERFPEYAAAAVEAGVRSQAAMRLYDAVDSRAILNLYSRSVGAFDELGELGDLFNDHTMMAISYAREIDDRDKAAQQRELVGQAVGVAMERYEFSHGQAFAFLTRLSQRLGIDLPQAAEILVDSSEERASAS